MLFDEDIKMLEFLDVWLETRNYTPNWGIILERTGLSKHKATSIINKLTTMGFLTKTTWGKDLNIFTLKVRIPALKRFKAKVITSNGVPQEIWSDVDMELKFVDKINGQIRILRTIKPKKDEGIEQ
jgi:hypothetical protein